ncbi:hypothetical protein RIR_jg2974.t1 [Rhizophagus irregularis DAOM 181602=DAOM 197198]|uniref:Uncharacterized protein n=1 Tax=Rhizophagus irregularis (strain DAOM 197198w) TaxID=1432141 RepID=A0A015IR59_RHIIW|nr:hypothetical protein RirG_213440 [Rhizophagus irregularis DAOM 197198w]GBC40794.1 hypothetical protein RIR_jg2974.t1 [Rhizophagus irregularis DAOM 181602=DAOM 197198]
MSKYYNVQTSEFETNIGICTANWLCRMSSDMQPIIDHIRNLSKIWPKFGRFALLPICLISTSVIRQPIRVFVAPRAISIFQLTYLTNHKKTLHPVSRGRPKGKSREQNSRVLDDFSLLPSQQKQPLFDETYLRDCMSDKE